MTPKRKAEQVRQDEAQAAAYEETAEIDRTAEDLETLEMAKTVMTSGGRG